MTNGLNCVCSVSFLLTQVSSCLFLFPTFCLVKASQNFLILATNSAGYVPVLKVKVLTLVCDLHILRLSFQQSYRKHIRACYCWMTGATYSVLLSDLWKEHNFLILNSFINYGYAAFLKSWSKIIFKISIFYFQSVMQ